MQKVNKINVKLINKEDDLGNSRLEFKLSGSNINYIVANTIRRLTLSCIPIYAFNEFKFDKNTSVFHNNYLKLRLRNMPVWGIENTVDFMDTVKETVVNEEKDYNYNEEADDVVIDVDKQLNSSTLKQLTMYVTAKNKTNEITTVTTADAKFYCEEKQINTPYKVSIPIVKLQPGQEIAFSAITQLGVEEKDTMFTPVCISVYKQVKEDEFDFIIESRGQITEERIIEVALINIERKLKNIIKLMNEKKSDESIKKIEMETDGMIVLFNEDNTMGNLLSKGLQQHNSVEFAGYNLPHPLAKKVNIHYKLKSGASIKKVMEDVVNYYIELFEEIGKIFSKTI
jgi:DNA-directed RNA polymerase subunit L